MTCSCAALRRRWTELQQNCSHATYCARTSKLSERSTGVRGFDVVIIARMGSNGIIQVINKNVMVLVDESAGVSQRSSGAQ